jgi:hypothetical protein
MGAHMKYMKFAVEELPSINGNHLQTKRLHVGFQVMPMHNYRLYKLRHLEIQNIT